MRFFDSASGPWLRAVFLGRRMSGDASRTHSAKMHRDRRLSDCADRFVKE